MNLVSSIPASGCRRSDPDPPGCATPSPFEENAPANQGVEDRTPTACSPLPSVDIPMNAILNDSTRTSRTSLNPPDARSWQRGVSPVGGPRHRPTNCPAKFASFIQSVTPRVCDFRQTLARSHFKLSRLGKYPPAKPGALGVGRSKRLVEVAAEQDSRGFFSSLSPPMRNWKTSRCGQPGGRRAGTRAAGRARRSGGFHSSLHDPAQVVHSSYLAGWPSVTFCGNVRCPSVPRSPILARRLTRL